MREILFRGKDINSGEWQFGYYSKCFLLSLQGDSPKHSIICECGLVSPVVSETIGQFTGLLDENNTKIFEGDIVRYSSSWNQTREYKEKYSSVKVVLYDDENASFTHCVPDGSTADGDIVEVIGNIHDNPELLESEAEE